MPQDKASQSNKKPLNNKDTECPHKDPKISSISNHQSYCTAEDGVAKKRQAVYLGPELFSLNREDRKAVHSVTFADS